MLRARGIPLVEYTAVVGDVPLTEISLLREDGERWTDDEAARLCIEAFGVAARPGVVTYVSRGTDADAESVLARFDLDGRVRREAGEEGEVVVVTVAAEDMRRVPESRLHTALEAALNAEVRVEVTTDITLCG